MFPENIRGRCKPEYSEYRNVVLDLSRSGCWEKYRGQGSTVSLRKFTHNFTANSDLICLLFLEDRFRIINFF